MDLRHFADTFGGIPLFLLLIVYFVKNNKTVFQKFLLFSCIVALVIDVYLSFFWNKSSLGGPWNRLVGALARPFTERSEVN